MALQVQQRCCTAALQTLLHPWSVAQVQVRLRDTARQPPWLLHL